MFMYFLPGRWRFLVCHSERACHRCCELRNKILCFWRWWNNLPHDRDCLHRHRRRNFLRFCQRYAVLAVLGHAHWGK